MLLMLCYVAMRVRVLYSSLFNIILSLTDIDKSVGTFNKENIVYSSHVSASLLMRGGLNASSDDNELDQRRTVIK